MAAQDSSHALCLLRPESRLPRVMGPLDIILFEGWMLGFSPVRLLTFYD